MLHERRKRFVLPQCHRTPVGNGSAAWGPDSNVVVWVGAVGDVGGDLLVVKVLLGRWEKWRGEAVLTIMMLT